MSNTSDTEEQKYEKLREEIVEVKVDYKAWLRSLKVIAVAVTIILALFAFFGYDKIESIESTIIGAVNERIAKTDSLISLVDQVRISELDVRLIELTHRVEEKEKELTQRIGQLNERIRAKERDYQLTLSNFERFLSKNQEVERRLLQLLPTNQRIDYSLGTYHIRPPEDYFEIRPFPSSFERNERVDIFLTFADKFDLNRAEALCIHLMKVEEGKHFLYRQYFFEVQEHLNKLALTLDVGEGDYTLETGFIEVKNDNTYFYRSAQKVEVQ